MSHQRDSSNEITNSEAVGYAELQDILRLSQDGTGNDVEDGSKQIKSNYLEKKKNITKISWREHMFSWLWPERQTGRINTDEIRRMEDFMMNSSKRSVNITRANRGQLLRQTTCPQTLSSEDLSDIQMQEFLSLNNEPARRSNQKALSQQRRSKKSNDLLPLWLILVVPLLVAVLNIVFAHYLYPDLFQPLPEAVGQ